MYVYTRNSNYYVKISRTEDEFCLLLPKTIQTGIGCNGEEKGRVAVMCCHFHKKNSHYIIRLHA